MINISFLGEYNLGFLGEIRKIAHSGWKSNLFRTKFWKIKSLFQTACFKEERDVLVYGDRRWITNLHYAFQDDNFLVSCIFFYAVIPVYIFSVCCHSGHHINITPDKLILKGGRYTYRVDSFVRTVLPPFWKGATLRGKNLLPRSTLRRKNLLPLGANSSLLKYSFIILFS